MPYCSVSLHRKERALMARKKNNNGSGGPSWMDTYADMVTLLLTFFVLLFAMSSVDATKWQALVKAFAGSEKADKMTSQQAVSNPHSLPSDLTSIEFGSGDTSQTSESSGNVTEVETYDDLYPYLKYYVETHNLSDSVNVYKGKDYTFVVFQNTVFFDGDSAEIRQEGKNILDYLCKGFVNISDQIGQIGVYGHTAETSDSKTTSGRIVDRRLSSERAVNVELYIDLKNIVASRKMYSVGYGMYRPLVPYDGTEVTRKKNRRVELFISKAGSGAAQLDQIYSEINASH